MIPKEVKTTHDLAEFLTESLKDRKKSYFYISEIRQILERVNPQMYCQIEGSDVAVSLRFPDNYEELAWHRIYICNLKMKCKRTTKPRHWGPATYDFFYEKFLPEGDNLVIDDIIAKQGESLCARAEQLKAKESLFLNLLLEHGFNSIEDFGEWINSNTTDRQRKQIMNKIWR